MIHLSFAMIKRSGHLRFYDGLRKENSENKMCIKARENRYALGFI